ncbi:MAG: exonuclease, partial [Spirochaetia bacterium]|nr:exonuclease [Spirochaetia bacterium]
AIESNLYSEYWELAGTVDTIAEFDGVLSIIDYKTSEKPKPREWIDNYFVQATAYLCMYYELTGLKAKQLVIIMTCENSEVEVYIEKDIKKYILLLKTYLNKFVEDMQKNL